MVSLGRKASGGRYKKSHKKKLYERAGQPISVKLGEQKRKIKKTRAGKNKLINLTADKINIIDRGNAKKVKIKTVLETPSNRFLARQNILVKGAIVETEIGKAKITNRPSQEGMVQGILIKE